MSLPWIRLDTGWMDHPKILRLLEKPTGYRTVFVWFSVLTYTGKHELGGFVPANTVPSMRGRRADMNALVTVGLLDVVPGGWQVHDWNDYQASSESASVRRERAQRAANARWHPENVRNLPNAKEG